jgi:hypothetical protein
VKEPFLVGGFAASARECQAVEGEAGQSAKVAIALKASQAVFLQPFLSALAGYYSGVVGAT